MKCPEPEARPRTQLCGIPQGKKPWGSQGCFCLPGCPLAAAGDLSQGVLETK